MFRRHNLPRLNIRKEFLVIGNPSLDIEQAEGADRYSPSFPDKKERRTAHSV